MLIASLAPASVFAAPPEPEELPEAEAPVTDWHIMVDQFGYRVGDDKVAVIVDPQIGFNNNDNFIPGNTYQVKRVSNDAVVFQGEPVPWNGGMVDPMSGDRAWWFDFSIVGVPGEYYIYDVEKNAKSYNFRIGDAVYEEVMYHALRMFYYNREGIAHTEPYAEAPWLDDAAWIGPGQDKEARDVLDINNLDKLRDVSGGWMDAGDTNKYVTFVNGIVHSLMTVYENDKNFYWDFDLNIPESHLDAPDILSELKWEMDWLIKMNNDDGSTLIKSGMQSRDATSPPSKDTTQRVYNGRESTAAAIAVAGMFAHGALVYDTVPVYEDYAIELAKRAEKSWDWYIGHLDAGTRNVNVDRGEVRSGNANRTLFEQDMMALTAAVYLYDLTGKETYHNYIKANYDKVPPVNADTTHFWYSAFMTWSVTEVGLAMLYYANLADADPAIVRDIFEAYTNAAMDLTRDTPYDFIPNISAYRAYIYNELHIWGGHNNRSIRGFDAYLAGELELVMGKMDEFYKRSANQLHYFHGVNPFNKTFLTNMKSAGASDSVMYMYHEWFQNNANPAVNIAPPGYLVGGPNKFWTTGLTPPDNQPHMKSYIDMPHNYRNSAWGGGSYQSYAYTEPMCAYQGNYVMLLSKYVGYTTGVAPDLQNELQNSEPLKGIPYVKGAPAPVPGLIEAENFDDGGQGISYHTSKTARTTREYRVHEVLYVDIEKCDAGGFNINNVRADDWLNYTVKVAKDGVYDLTARVSSAVNDAKYHIEFDGDDLTGALAVPNFGVQEWANVYKKGVDLTAGQYVMKFYFDTPGTCLDYIVLTPRDMDIRSVEPVIITGRQGVKPVMPGVVTAVLADGSSLQVPVEWDAIDPVDYSILKSFTVNGLTINNYPVTATVNVKYVIESIEPINVKVTVNKLPELPATVDVTYNDGFVRAAGVAWDAVDHRDCCLLQTFTVNGKVGFTDLDAAANVTVVPYLLGAPVASAAGGEAWNSMDMAFDGDLDTYFETQTGNNRYVGLNLGAGKAEPLGFVRFFVTPGNEGAFAGAAIQGSNTGATAGLTALAAVPSAQAGWNTVDVDNQTAWQYMRLLKANNTNRIIMPELEFYPLWFHEIDFMAPGNSQQVAFKHTVQHGKLIDWDVVIGKYGDLGFGGYVNAGKEILWALDASSYVGVADTVFPADAPVYTPIALKPVLGAPEVYITGPSAVVSGSGATAEYVISVKNMPMVSGIEVEFELDGDFLGAKEFIPVGFGFLGDGNYGSPIYWTNIGNRWIGKVTLFDADGISGDVDILRMVYNAAEGKLGLTEVKLNYLTMSYMGGPVDSIIVAGSVQTNFLKYYSKYDLNFDGVVDLHDLTYAMLYMMVKEGDPDWEKAQVADFHEDGRIDVEDLLLILANYTVPYYD